MLTDSAAAVCSEQFQVVSTLLQDTSPLLTASVIPTMHQSPLCSICSDPLIQSTFSSKKQQHRDT